MKKTIFRVVATYSLVELDIRFEGAHSLLHQSDNHSPDDGGNKHLRNVDKFIVDYTAQRTRI
jgi:hypothetical protein